jgi:hypothetical protein
MQNNMYSNSFCILFILQYAKYSKYATKCASICKLIAPICKIYIICNSARQERSLLVPPGTEAVVAAAAAAGALRPRAPSRRRLERRRRRRRWLLLLQERRCPWFPIHPVSDGERGGGGGQKESDELDCCSATKHVHNRRRADRDTTCEVEDSTHIAYFAYKSYFLYYCI